MVRLELYDTVACALTGDFRKGFVIDTGWTTGIVKVYDYVNTYDVPREEFDDGIWEVRDFSVTTENDNIDTAEHIDTSVHSPSHYNAGDIEAIDYIKQVTKHYAGDVGFCVGNVIKYLSRAPHKNGKQDLQKALKYLEWAVDQYETD